MQVTIQPCPLCDSAMVCYDTAVISGENHTRAHYLLACSTCGHGPAQAFTTTSDAIYHWNVTVNSELKSFECR